MVLVNGQDPPEPPYHHGAVVGFDDGRLIHIFTADEARDLAAAAQFVADNWEE